MDHQHLYGDDYAGAKGILSSFLPDGTSVTHGDNKNRRSDPASEGKTAVQG